MGSFEGVMKTKTTFELESSLLKQLKTAAVRAGKSVRDLLTEGAQAVLEKYDALEDREVLLRRAEKARLRMRNGYFSGPASLSANIDSLVYGVAERPPDYGKSEPKSKRRRK